MRSVLVAFTVIITLLVAEAQSQSCAAGTAQESKGNWYCSQVKAITYSNFPGHGSYHRVTNMDAASGECSTAKYDYSGSLSPLNEELSIHIRGPILLKQVAVYAPAAGPNNKRNPQRAFDGATNHGHRHIHNHRGNKAVHDHGQAKRSVGQVVSATIDGQLASWINSYSGPVPSSSVPPVQADALPFSPLESPATIVKPVSTAGTSKIAIGDRKWSRQAYYDADAGTVKGITFLNHFGGTDGIPGTVDGGPAFGDSLSYAANDGKSGAFTPQMLSKAMVEDNVEIVIMSNKSCSDGGCGYTRPGGVNYHGFVGSQKVFLFEFSMPFSNKTGSSEDMPAIWLLNAQVPLTSQYGTNPDCSCWTSGCGEFDVFEVLDSGNFRCKSTLHMAPAGGSSDWFQRPFESSIKAAAIINGRKEVAAIRVLDQEQTFDGILEESDIDDWLDTEGTSFYMDR